MTVHNPNGKIFGYIRVSTREQNEDRQIFALTEYGVKPSNIYMDKMTGSSLNRPAYKHLIRTLRRGDILVIKSIDRLGRNYQDVIDQWRLITQDLGVGIHVVDMPTLNTSGDPKDLMSRFITDMMLQVLSFVAETERANTLKRQSEGIAAMKRRGQKIGRKAIKIPKEFWSWYIVWRQKTLTVAQICDIIKISPRTFYRRVRELDKQYGDFSVEKLEKLIINEDIEYKFEQIELQAFKDSGMEVNLGNMPHREYTKNMRHMRHLKEGPPAPARPKDELDSIKFDNEFKLWWREFIKRYTGGWLIRTREHDRILEDAHAQGMGYFEYLDKLIDEGTLGKYCERRGKLPNDYRPGDPKPPLFKYMTKEYRFAQNGTYESGEYT